MSASDNDIIAVVTAFPNASISEYASRLVMHPAELMKRLTAMPLKVALAEARAESLADASVLAESLAVRAVNTIAHIMDSPFSKDSDRVTAARAMVAVGIKLSIVVHTTPALEMMKAALDEKGIQLKERKRYARMKGESAAVPSYQTPPEDEVPCTVVSAPAAEPVVADEVMTRLQDILKKHKGNDNAGD